MQVVYQGAAVLAAIVYSGVASFVLLKLIGLVMPLRATASEEAEGLDVACHGEEAYMHVGGASPIEGEAAHGMSPSFNPVRADA
jgi:ammonium transporter, Amt family